LVRAASGVDGLHAAWVVYWLCSMRTSVVAVTVGLCLTGCVIGDEGTVGTPPAGDDGVDPGTDPGTDPGKPSMPTPKLDVSADKTTISTELATTNMVTLTLRASGGFSGAVTLAASAVDTAGAPITGWTVTLDKTTVDVPADGSATAVATLKIPSAINAAAGTVKIDTTSSLGASAVQSAVTVAKQITYTMALNGTRCIYPVPAGSTTTIAQGTKVRWVNSDPANRITIHIGGIANNPIAGFNHEPDPGMAPSGGSYEQTANSATGAVDWYCHNRDGSQGITLKAAP
jgi:predicted RecA/RadA family phage recombinase